MPPYRGAGTIRTPHVAVTGGEGGTAGMVNTGARTGPAGAVWILLLIHYFKHEPDPKRPIIP